MRLLLRIMLLLFLFRVELQRASIAAEDVLRMLPLVGVLLELFLAREHGVAGTAVLDLRIVAAREVLTPAAVVLNVVAKLALCGELLGAFGAEEERIVLRFVEETVLMEVGCIAEEAGAWAAVLPELRARGTLALRLTACRQRLANANETTVRVRLTPRAILATVHRSHFGGGVGAGDVEFEGFWEKHNVFGEEADG